MAKLFYRSSDSAFLGKGFVTAHESLEPPNYDLASMSHAISSESTEIPPGSQSFVVIAQPLDEVGAKPQTIHDASH